MALSPEIKSAVNYAADRAAGKAVKTTLLTIGVDATDAAAAREAQQDMHFLHRMRMTTETKSLKVWIAMVAAGLSLFNTLLVLAIQRLLGV